MPGIVMNVGPNAIASAGAASGGGQTLGAAHGSITINVNNVTQANSILQNSGRQMAQAFANTARAARAATQVQIQQARLAATQATSTANQTIAANKTVISNLLVSSNQQKAAHQQAMQIAQQQAQAAKTTTAQQTQVFKQQSNAARLSFQQQSQAAKLYAQTAAQGYQAATRAVNAQIQQNRLLISNINLTAAQARAAARAQQQAAQQAQTAWQQTANVIGKLQFQLAGIGLGAGLLVQQGVGYAATLQEARLQLAGITGSIAEAEALTADLQKKGREAGIPFQQMLNYAVQLLPTLNRSTEELERWFDITRRVAVLNRGPTGGLQGAAFSLREAFLSVQQGGRDFVSLADRFNISKKALIEALEVSGGDFVEAIDIVLTKMGITTELADSMADSFNASFAVAKDAALQLAAAGFTPLLTSVGGVLRVLADFFTVVAQNNPELAVFAAGMVTLVAVGAPLLLLLQKLTSAWIAMGVAAQAALLKSVGAIGGIGAGLALGNTVGRRIGTFVGNEIRAGRGEKPLSDEEVNQNFKDLVFNVVNALNNAGIFVAEQIYNIGIAISKGNALLYNTLADANQRLADATNIPSLKKFFQDIADFERQQASEFSFQADTREIQKSETVAKSLRDIIDFATRLGVTGFEIAEAQNRVSESTGKYTDEQVDRITQHYFDITELTRQTNTQLMDENRSYSRQRISLEKNYNKQVSREAEDFRRQRAKAERDFSKSILDSVIDSARQRDKWQEDLDRSIAQAQEDSAERRAEMQEDHDKRIQDAKEDSDDRIKKLESDADDKLEKDREDHLEKIQEIEEDFRKDEEDRQRKHRDALWKAASQFDAFAIAQENREHAEERAKALADNRDKLDDQNKSFNESLEEQREATRKSIEEERKALQKRLQEENESYAERLDDEAKALEKSIRQQREAHALQLEEQAENDALRLEQMRKDFDQQKRDEDEERRIRNERAASDFAEQLLELDSQHAERIQQIKDHAALERKQLDDKFADDMIKLSVQMEERAKRIEAFEKLAIDAFDRYWQHQIDTINGSIGPQPLNPSVRNFQQGLPPSLGGGNGGSTNNTTNTNAPAVTINIYPQPGQSPDAIASSVIDEYMRRLGPRYAY